MTLERVAHGGFVVGRAEGKVLFVTGGSGGGVLTSWIVGKTDRFAAAVTQKPVINWVSESLTADLATFAPRYWFGAMPWEQPMEYWRRSPLSLVGNVKTPTMVVVGDEDAGHAAMLGTPRREAATEMDDKPLQRGAGVSGCKQCNRRRNPRAAAAGQHGPRL